MGSWQMVKEKTLVPVRPQSAPTRDRHAEKSASAISAQQVVKRDDPTACSGVSTFVKERKQLTTAAKSLAIRPPGSETKLASKAKLEVLSTGIASNPRPKQRFRIVAPTAGSKDVKVQASSVVSRSKFPPSKDENLGFPSEWVDEMHDLLENRLNGLTHKRLHSMSLESLAPKQNATLETTQKNSELVNVLRFGSVSESSLTEH